jgi:uncharacterized protein YifN (PemK superfamily)
MALTYYPALGEILLCIYDTGFVAPEMTKRRPVVVVSPRLRRRGSLVAVVPLSTTAPEQVEPHHCMIRLERPLPSPFDAEVMWAKCDMVATVGLQRLDRFKGGRRSGSSARMYLSGSLSREQMIAVRASILCGLGLSSLTVHLCDNM